MLSLLFHRVFLKKYL